MSRPSGRRMKRLSIHHPPTTPVTIVVWKHSCRYVYRLDVGRQLPPQRREVLSDETKSTQNPAHPARSRVHLATANNKNPQHNTERRRPHGLLGAVRCVAAWLDCVTEQRASVPVGIRLHSQLDGRNFSVPSVVAVCSGTLSASFLHMCDLRYAPH